MRKICEYCKASLYNDYCKGDDEQCIKVMRYDMGYKDAVEKATKWLAERTMFGVHPCGGAGLVIEFKKAMEL